MGSSLIATTIFIVAYKTKKHKVNHFLYFFAMSGVVCHPLKRADTFVDNFIISH